MNLRTITLWAIYRPKFKHIVTTEPTKKALLKKHRVPTDCVVVKLKGHYVRRTP